MAAVPFEQFAANARAQIPDATDDELRQAYAQHEQMSTPPDQRRDYMTNGPSREDFAANVRAKVPDATDDEIEQAYGTLVGKTGVWEDVKRATASGYAQNVGGWLARVAKAPAELSRGFGGEPTAIGAALERQGQDTEAWAEGVTERNAPSTWAQERPWYSPGKIATGTAEATTSLLPTVVTGVAGKMAGLGNVASAAAGGMVGGNLEAAGAYEQMVADGMDPNEAALRSSAYGAGSAVLNALPLGRMLSRAPGRLMTGGLEAATETAEGPLQAMFAGKIPNPLDDPKGAIDALVAATRQEAEGVAVPSFILGAALGGGGKAEVKTKDADKADVARRLQALGIDPGLYDAVDLEALGQQYELTPEGIRARLGEQPRQLPGPRAPADWNVDARERAMRPGEAPPADMALPPPQGSAAPGRMGQFDVSADGTARNLTQAEAQARQAQRAEAEALGLGEAERIAWRAGQDVRLPLKDEKFREFERALTPEARRELVAMRIDAEQYFPAYEKTIQGIQDAIAPGAHKGVKATKGNYGIPGLKGWDRITQKLVAEEGGNVSALKDFVRSTVFVNNRAEAEAALEAVLRQFGQADGTKVRRSLIDVKPDKFGYVDVKVNVPGPNGRIYEVQINTPRLFDMKEDQGHKFYEQARDIQARAQKENRALTWQEKRAIVKLRQQSRAFYAPGLAAFVSASKSSPSRATTQAGVETRQEPSASRSLDSNSSGSSQITRPLYDQARQSGPGASLSVTASPPAPSIARLNPAEGKPAVMLVNGQRVPVRFQVIEADQLTSSDQPGFPADMQPRQRGERAASQAQVKKIVDGFEPAYLGEQPEAQAGSPVVSQEGVVLSGNGRVMALRQVYQANDQRAAAYRQHLEALGYDVAGMRNPVLVRVPEQPIEDPRAFVVGANKPVQAAMSATETALTDADALTPDVIAKLDPSSSIESAANNGFVKAFLAKLPVTEHGTIMGADGRLSAAGKRRLEGALLAKAYGGNPRSNDLLNRTLEDTSDNARAITGAMLDAAAEFVHLRQAIADGKVDPGMDVSASLIEALDTMSQLRSQRRTVNQELTQQDAVGRPEAVLEFLRAFVEITRTTVKPKKKGGKETVKVSERARSRAHLGEFLTYLAREAQSQGATGQMFESVTDPTELIAQGRELLLENRDEIAASRLGDMPGGLSVRQLRRVLGPVLDRLPRDVRTKIKLLEHAGELPGHLLRSAHPDSEGLINMRTGEIWLIARNIRSYSRAQSALAHELVGHFGLKRMLGSEQFNKLVQAVRKARFTDKAIAQTWAEAEGRYKGEDTHTLAVEALAITAEKFPTHNLVRKVRAMFRYWARTQLDLPLELTQNDLVYMLNRARDQLLTEKRRTQSRNRNDVDPMGYIPSGSPSGTQGQVFPNSLGAPDPYYGSMAPRDYSDLSPGQQSMMKHLDGEVDKARAENEKVGGSLTSQRDAYWRAVRYRADMLRSFRDRNAAAERRGNRWRAKQNELKTDDQGRPLDDQGRPLDQQGRPIPEGQQDIFAQPAPEPAPQAEPVNEAAGFQLTPSPRAPGAQTDMFGGGGQQRQERAPRPAPAGQRDLFASRAPRAEITDTPEFKRWFGKSKVVDENGEPRVMYHGTGSDFDTFEHTADIGFHFGTPEPANFFAKPGIVANGRIMPVYLRIENPLRLPDLHLWGPSDVKSALLERGIITPQQDLEADIVDRETVRDWLKAKGYDGIVYRNEAEGKRKPRAGERIKYSIQRHGDKYRATLPGGYQFASRPTPESAIEWADHGARNEELPLDDSYIVFDSNQIKSATGNRGTFSRRNPSILKSAAPQGPTVMGRSSSSTAGATAPPQAPPQATAPSAPQGPQKVQAGGGEYTTAPFMGMSAEVQRVLMGVMGAEDARIAGERGGKVSWTQTGKEAEKLLGTEFGRLFNDLVNRTPRSAANAANLEAFARIVNTAGKAVVEAAREYNRTGGAAELKRLVAAKEQLGLVLAPFMGYRTEAGRALQVLQKMQADYADALQIFEALGNGTEQAMRQYAERISKAGSVEEALKVTRAAYTPSLWDQFYEIWINGLLSGPWTHAVNITSNALFNALETATEGLVGAVSKNTSSRIALARVAGQIAGTQLGLANAGKAFMTEDPQLTPRQQIESERGKAVPGKFGRAVRIPGRALMAEDELAKAIAYTGELHAIAMERALAKSPSNPEAVFDRELAALTNDKGAQKRARLVAERMTFQTPLGPIGNAGLYWLNKSKVGRILVPFVRTPTNILKRAMEYTIAAPAMKQVREDYAAGGKARDMVIGRMAVGSTLMAGVVGMVIQGMITGAGPEDPKERDQWMRLGKKPYSVKVGDRWVKYNRFEPVGMLLGVAADLGEIGQAMPEKDAGDIATMLATSVALNLGDKTFLRGVIDFSRAYSDPKRYGAQWAQGLAGTAVPNILAQSARAGDPYVREARGLVDSLKARVPGLRQDLPVRRDIAGEKIERSLVEPLAATRERRDPLAEAMLTLGVEKGKPSRKVTVDGRTLELDGHEYESMVEYVQGIRWKRLTGMVQSPKFQALMRQDSLRASSVLEREYEKLGEAARMTWLRNNRAVLAKLRTAPKRQYAPSQYASQGI